MMLAMEVNGKMLEPMPGAAGHATQKAGG